MLTVDLRQGRYTNISNIAIWSILADAPCSLAAI